MSLSPDRTWASQQQKYDPCLFHPEDQSQRDGGASDDRQTHQDSEISSAASYIVPIKEVSPSPRLRCFSIRYHPFSRIQQLHRCVDEQPLSILLEGDPGLDIGFGICLLNRATKVDSFQVYRFGSQIKDFVGSSHRILKVRVLISAPNRATNGEHAGTYLVGLRKTMTAFSYSDAF